MATYTTAPADVEMGCEERTVVLVEKKSSSGWMWKVCIAILLLGLCFGGLMFAWQWSGRPDLLRMLSDQREAQPKTELETERHHTLRRIGSNAKAAIHLEGSFNDADKLEWKTNRGQAFVQGDFTLENNQIIIPHNGLYFVYSQASFIVSCSEEDDQDRNLSHRIWRFTDSKNKNTTLMSAVRSACLAKTSEDDSGSFNTLYLGAVFQLNSGDRLWTETTQLEDLETESGKNFFGVFAL